MTKAERAKAIRARFKSLYPLAAKPMMIKAAKRRVWTPSRPPVTDDIFGDPVFGRADPKAGWVFMPDEKKRATIAERRTERVSPLMKIAERWASSTWRAETKRLDLYHA